MQILLHGRWLLLVGLVLVLCPLNLAADTQHVYLRNGRVLTGRVVNQSARKIWLRTDRRILVIAKSRIRRIAYDTPLEQQHLKELRAERRVADRRLQQRLNEELEKARKEWEAEQAKKQQRQLAVERVQKQTERQQVLTGGLWRSAVMPGWGQYHRGEHKKGYVFGSLFVGSLVLWYRADADYKQAAENLRSTTLNLSAIVLSQRSTASIVASLTLAQAANDEKRVAATNASIFQTLAIGLYLVNMTDALLSEGYVGAGSKKSAGSTGPRFMFGFTRHSYAAGVQFSF